jgi:hypothetical protein
VCSSDLTAFFGSASSGGGSNAAGTPNTGGGGSGKNTSGGAYAGGSGIVVISYDNFTYRDFTSIDVGLTYTKTVDSTTGNLIYKFTAGTGTVTI